MSVLSQRETLHLEREQALIKWRQRATELNDARSDENCPELRAARAVIDQMSVDIARLDAEHETLLERSQLARALSGALDYWVREHAHGMHREYDGPKPELGPGETVLQAIDRCREKYLAIEGEFWQVQDSSWDAKKLAVREYVKALAAKSAPKVIGLIEGSRTIEWPRDKSPHSIGHGPVMSIPLVDPVALLAWFAPEQLIRRLEEEVAAAEDIRLSLKLDEIESAMLATQRVQEAFIRLAEASGETIDRWLNADPRAVLGLSASTGGSTSPRGSTAREQRAVGFHWIATKNCSAPIAKGLRSQICWRLSMLLFNPRAQRLFDDHPPPVHAFREPDDE